MMNMHNAALVLDESLTTVKCKFTADGISYLFAVTKELASTLLVGDFVNASTTKGIKALEVVEIDDDNEIVADSHIEYAFVFQRVDTNELARLEYNAKQQTEQLKRLQRTHMRNQVREQIKSQLMIDDNFGVVEASNG